MYFITRDLRRLGACDRGVALTTEVVLVAIFMTIGMIVAFSAVRDSVVSEFADTGLAVQNSNQSFVVNGVGGASSTTAGYDYTDELDPCDGEDIANGVLDFSFLEPPQDESDLDSVIQAKEYDFVMTRGGFTWNGTGDFDDGSFDGSPYWPGDYTIDGTTITVDFYPLGGGWDDGTLVLDGSDPNDMSGMITWINSISGFVWEAMYQLICR